MRLTTRFNKVLAVIPPGGGIGARARGVLAEARLEVVDRASIARGSARIGSSFAVVQPGRPWIRRARSSRGSVGAASSTGADLGRSVRRRFGAGGRRGALPPPGDRKAHGYRTRDSNPEMASQAELNL